MVLSRQAWVGVGWGGGGAEVRGKGLEAAFSVCPGSLQGGRWAVGMVPRPGMGYPGWVWSLVQLSPLMSPPSENCAPQACAG